MLRAQRVLGEGQIERLIRRNPRELSGLFGFKAGGTVYTRINRLAMNDGLVGYALDALREAVFGDHADRLILVDYEVLTQRRPATMEQIYAFVGEPINAQASSSASRSPHLGQSRCSFRFLLSS